MPQCATCHAPHEYLSAASIAFNKSTAPSWRFPLHMSLAEGAAWIAVAFGVGARATYLEWGAGGTTAVTLASAMPSGSVLALAVSSEVSRNPWLPAASASAAERHDLTLGLHASDLGFRPKGSAHCNRPDPDVDVDVGGPMTRPMNGPSKRITARLAARAARTGRTT